MGMNNGTRNGKMSKTNDEERQREWEEGSERTFVV